VAKNALNPARLMSIATKVVIQMNAKLGGIPWHLQIPLKVNYYDIYLNVPAVLIILT
jgi:hypothetical protein